MRLNEIRLIQFLVICFLMIINHISHAQQIQLSFEVMGVQDKPDSVLVNNRSETLLMNGDDILLLDVMVNIESIKDRDEEFIIYPNPSRGTSLLEFNNPQDSKAYIQIYDLTGKVVLSEILTEKQGQGIHQLSGLKKSYYVVNISSNNYSYSKLLLVSHDSKGELSLIKHLNNTPQPNHAPQIFKSGSFIHMDYLRWTQLMFTAYYDSFKCEIELIPFESQVIEFEFLPVADFTADQLIVPLYDTVHFHSTSRSITEITGLSWDYGNGNSSNSMSPNLVCEIAGKHTISLTAYNEFGENTKTKTEYIDVGHPPIVHLIVNKTQALIHEEIAFTTNSFYSPTSWLWDFGDGKIAETETYSHAYDSAGLYLVNVLALNPYGSDLDTLDTLIEIGELPLTEFTVDERISEICEEINFINTTSSDSAVISWLWEFGDGSTSNVQQPSHIYSATGTYTVSLTASNKYGEQKEQKEILVNSTEGLTITDINGHVYKVVNIGSQTWMAENLRATHYADGTSLELVTDSAIWANANLLPNNEVKYYCYPNNNVYNEAEVFGALYTYAAAVKDLDVPGPLQGVCPTGWHIPTIEDWEELESFFSNNGHDGQEGLAMKAQHGWATYGGENGIDAFGFTAIPAGTKNSQTFETDFFGRGAAWHCSPDTSGNYIGGKYLLDTSDNLETHTPSVTFGVSVRCVKD